MTKLPSPDLVAVDDHSFNRLVLKSPVPAVVCFMAPWCAASQGLIPALGRLAGAYAGRLRVALLDTDDHGEVAEQFGVWAIPTLSVFRGGDEVLRHAGFLPEGLARLLFDAALDAAGARARLWLPSEQQYEDIVLAPMLDRLGLAYRRQVPCAVRAGGRSSRGLVDFLVYRGAAPDDEPLTLFENKRALAGEPELRAAVAQALGYAQALGLPSFVVADPGGMRVYARDGERARLARAFGGPDVEQCEQELLALLRELLTDA